MTTPLPRSLDVGIIVSLSQTELATDMTMLCVLTPAVDWPPESRLRFYDDFDAFAADVPANISAYQAGVAFFSQAGRPQTLAVARVFTASIAAFVKSAALTVTDALKAVTDGSLVIQAGEDPTTLTGLDFSGCTDLASVAAVLGTGWTVDDTSIVFTSPVVGDDQISAFATAADEGTFAGALLGLTAAAGATKSNGYTYGVVTTTTTTTTTTTSTTTTTT